MKKKTALVSLLMILVLLLLPQAVSAHQDITVGDYTIEYGWLNEPAVVGQSNAVVINISQKDTQDANIDPSGMQVQAVYGGKTKNLSLQPLGEDTPGQFIAPMTPTLPGVYTIHLGGKLGATELNSDVQPEEVQTADTVQFPPVDAGQAANSSGPASAVLFWLGAAGLVCGIIGIILGALALSRKPAK